MVSVVGFVAVLTLVRGEHAELAPEHQYRAAPSTLCMNRAATSAVSVSLLAEEPVQAAATNRAGSRET